MVKYSMWRLLVVGLLLLAGCDVNYSAMKDPTVRISTNEATGSGVVIGPYLVLTAAHVVEEAQWIKVGDGVATLVWIGGEDLDVALLRVDTPIETKPVRINCAPLQEGTKLWAVGFPLTVLPKIVVEGTVVTDELYENMNLATLAMIPGMSGGPVFNEKGELVGLNRAIIVMPLRFASSATGVAGIQPIKPVCDAQVGPV